MLQFRHRPDKIYGMQNYYRGLAGNRNTRHHLIQYNFIRTNLKLDIYLGK